MRACAKIEKMKLSVLILSQLVQLIYSSNQTSTNRTSDNIFDVLILKTKDAKVSGKYNRIRGNSSRRRFNDSPVFAGNSGFIFKRKEL